MLPGDALGVCDVICLAEIFPNVSLKSSCSNRCWRVGAKKDKGLLGVFLCVLFFLNICMFRLSTPHGPNQARALWNHFQIKENCQDFSLVWCDTSTYVHCASFNFSTEIGSPRDLVTSDVTDTSFAVSWAAAPGNVRQYRIRWKSLFSDEEGEKTIPGGTTATVLEGLTPETRYQVSVFAGYSQGEGQPLVGEETTDSK